MDQARWPCLSKKNEMNPRRGDVESETFECRMVKRQRQTNASPLFSESHGLSS
jgi:hypothetical protein